MSSRNPLMVLVVAAVMLFASSGMAVTDEQVQQAIRRGVNFLYSKQHAWGHWDLEKAKANPDQHDHANMQYGGWTAIVCYGLLSAGEDWQGNPKLARALEWLRKVDCPGTYGTGLRAHVWEKLPDSFLKHVKEDAEKLMAGISYNGGYHYKLGAGGKGDNSCTQYGVLGAWECEKRKPGSIDSAYWQKVENRFVQMQLDDGSWAYSDGRGSGTFNMTAAGLAMLYITQDYLHARAFQRPGIAENHPSRKRIEDGLAWYAKKFSPKNTSGYTIVGVERVALASGLKYFGGKDWYQSIAARLIRTQGTDGSWTGKRDGIIETAFKLVFLSRGRVPVAFNKLKIDGFSWNNRPSDMAKLTAWLSDEAEQNMNWQVVGIERSPVDWLDSPVLYLASHRALELDDEQAAKIKRYIDLGGTLVTHNDGTNANFTNSVRQLIGRIYPQYELKPVAEDDYLYNINYPVKRKPKLLSVHNGVRHMIIHCPRDIAEAFQLNSKRMIDSWYTMANIFFYATEVGRARPRLAQHYLKRKGSAGNSVPVARIRYDGNWNPEAGTWNVQNTFMTNEKSLRADVETIDLEELGTSEAALAHAVGTEKMQFTDAQTNAIKQYLEGGGVILFEAPGGTPQTLPFVESVKQLLTQAYPDQPIRTITATDKVISGSGINGFDCSRVDYRVFYKKRAGPTRQPMLMGMKVGGQLRVLISHEDISQAVLGQPVWGIFGYNTDSARKLLTNITLWAQNVRNGG